LQTHGTRGVRRRGGLAALALGLAALGPAGPAPADEPPPPPAPPVELDRLLKLPASVEVAGERRGSATKVEWRERFIAARAERDAAQAALDKAQAEIGEAAGASDPWQITPPGAPQSSTAEPPVNYQVRQEMRRQREELLRSERRLRELTIEADLAGVPADWRGE
jgi:hypothetical protein